MNTSLGYAKRTLTDTNVLLSGGGDKPLSDFIGSISWDATNRKIKYTPVGGSAIDLVTFGSLALLSSLDSYSLHEAYLLWGGKNFSGSYGPIDAAMVSELGACRTMFLKAAGIVIEYSTDAGATWTDYGVTNAQKVALFSTGLDFTIGKATADTASVNNMLRVTMRTSDANLYTILNKFVIFISTSGSTGSYCTIRCRTLSNYENNVDTWVTRADHVPISGYSGYNVINIADTTTYGNTKGSQYGEWQFIFGCTGHNSSTAPGLTVSKIFGFGGVGWTTPSTMAKTGHIYSFDSSQNATFPAKVTATSIIKSGGTADLFLKADGSVDSTAYLPLSGGTMTGTIKYGGANYEIIRTGGDDPTWRGGLKYSWSGSTTIALWGKSANSQFVWHAGADFSSSDLNGAAIRSYDFQVGRSNGTLEALIGGNKIWHLGNDGESSGLDADLLDGYHAYQLYNAATTYISNPNTSNTWVRIATINIPGTKLKIAGFTAIFSNREILNSTSFILTLGIRRSNTTNAADVRFHYTALQASVPRTISLRSDDNQTFYVYFKSVASSYTTYYNVTKLVTEGDITFENEGTASPISGTITKVDASKGGNVTHADYADGANTLDGHDSSEFKLKTSIWLPGSKQTKQVFSTFLDASTTNLHNQAAEELNLFRFFSSNAAASTYGYPVVDSHSLVFSLDGDKNYLRALNLDARTNDIYTIAKTNGTWGNWVKLLHTGNVSPSLDINGNTIRSTVGGVSSSYITVPYATNADTVDNKHADDFRNTIKDYTYYDVNISDTNNWFHIGSFNNCAYFNELDIYVTGLGAAMNNTIHITYCNCSGWSFAKYIYCGESTNSRSLTSIGFWQSQSNPIKLFIYLTNTYSNDYKYTGYRIHIYYNSSSFTPNTPVITNSSDIPQRQVLTYDSNIYANLKGTADLATSVYMEGTSEDVNYPLLFTTATANGNGRIYSDSHWRTAGITYNPSTTTLNVGTKIVSRHADHVQTSIRHLDAGLDSVNTDHGLYIGYGARTYTEATHFYYSTGTTDTTSSRTEFMQINSSGAYALTRFGVNGQNTSYNFYVNGSADFSNRLLIDTLGRVYPYSTSTRRAGMYGVHDTTKLGHIWSIGTNYMMSDDGADPANLYGLAYFHTDWSNNATYNVSADIKTAIGTYADGHQVGWFVNGVLNAAIGDYVWSRNGFIKDGSSDSYVLLGGGGHELVSAFATSGHNHEIQNLTNYSSRVYDATTSRTKNTVLAAPNGSNGAASFRALVAADIPTLTMSKISDAPSTKSLKINGTAYSVYTSSASLPTILAPTSGGTSGQVLKSTGSTPEWKDPGSFIAELYVRRVTETANNVPNLNRFRVREHNSGTAYNLPTNHFYHIYTAVGSDNAYATELAIPMTNDATLFVRNKRSSTWYPWVRLLDADPISMAGTYLLAKSDLFTTANICPGNRLYGLPGANITINAGSGSSSTVYGSTSLGTADSKKLMTIGDYVFYFANKTPSSTTTVTKYDGLQIIIDVGDFTNADSLLYGIIRAIYVYGANCEHTCTLTIDTQAGNSSTWTNVVASELKGWSGANVYWLNSPIDLGGHAALTTHIRKIRIRSYISTVNSNHNKDIPSISGLGLIGDKPYLAPSNMAANNHLYTVDLDMTGVFPSYVQSAGFKVAGKDNNYVLLAGGGTTALSSIGGGSSGGGSYITTALTSFNSSTTLKLLFYTSPTNGGNITEVHYNNNFYVNNSGVFYSSDRNLKTNIKDYSTFIKDNPIKLFDWKDGSGKDNIGFIAQEVEEWCPQAVGNNEDGRKTVNYKTALSALCSFLYNKIKDLEDKLNKLEKVKA